MRRGGGDVRHAHQRNAQMIVRVHGKAEAERLAEPRELLHLPHPAPVMMIAQYDLHRVLPDRRRQVAETSHGHIAGEWSIDAFREQAASNRRHVLHARGGIFEIAAIGQLFPQFAPDADGGLDRPSGVGVDADRHARTELLPHLFHSLDLKLRLQNARLELDVLETVQRDHPPGLLHEGCGRERLAIFIVAGVCALATAASVFVKWIGREGDRVAHPATNQLADRLADGFADQVQARHFDRGERPGRGVERILTGHVERLRAIAARSFNHGGEEAGDSKGVAPDQLIPQCEQRFGGFFAAVGFIDADHAVFADQLKNRAQGVGLVSPIGTAQRRIGHGNRVNSQVRDANG